MSRDTLAVRILNWFADHVLPWFLIGFLALAPVMIGSLIYLLWNDCSAPTVSLKKDEWTCTKTYIYYTWIRGVRYEHEGCANYEKDGA